MNRKPPATGGSRGTMPTKVVVNCFHYEVPVVEIVDSSPFFLAFDDGGNDGSHKFRFLGAASELPPVAFTFSREPAEPRRFSVLRCDRDPEEPCWTLTHVGGVGVDVRVDGPDRRQLSRRLDHSPWAKSTNSTSLYNVGELVDAGDVVRVKSLNRRPNTLTLSLFEDDTDEGKSDERKETDAPPPSKKLKLKSEERVDESRRDKEQLGKEPPSSLMDLPIEIIRKVVDQLPAETVVCRLPFVCSTLHEVARERTSWPTLDVDLEDFSHPRCEEDLALLCRNASESCDTLKLDVVGDCDAFIETTWKSLRRLDVTSIDTEFQRAVENDCFPVLEHLTFASFTHKGFVRLQDCPLPNLKSLTIFLSTEQESLLDDEDDDEEMDPKEFWAQFPRLETVCVEYECRRRLLENSLIVRGLKRGCLKKLRVLKLSGRKCAERWTYEHVDLFAHDSLEFLSWSYERSWADDVVPAAWLLERFPKVRKLLLGTGVVLDWSDVDADRVRSLRSVTATYGEASPVPLESMPFLEAASLTVFGNNNQRNCWHRTVVPLDFSRHTDLTALRLDGARTVDDFLDREGPPNLQFLELLEGIRLNVLTGPRLLGRVAQFPLLRRLVLDVTSLRASPQLARLFDENLTGIQSVKIMGSRSWYRPTGGSFEDDAKSLSALLPAWRCLIKPQEVAANSSVSHPAHVWLWKAGTPEPWRVLSPFEGPDAFFPTVPWLPPPPSSPQS